MTFSNRLDLAEFINAINDCNYTVVKLWAEFPNYYPRSDIDIFCIDINKIAKKILEKGNKYLDDGFEIKIDERKAHHKQIDFMYDGKIDFRFDLYGALPHYKNMNIKHYYFYSIIDKRCEKIINYNNKKHHLYVPNKIDEMIIRYLDYLEYFAKRNDKIKHLDYVRNKISINIKLDDFLDRFYLYISFPEDENQYSYFKKKKLEIADILKKVKDKGLVGSIKKVLFG